MFVKKPSKDQIAEAVSALEKAFGPMEKVEDAPVKDYMLKWLSSFAPDMTFYDAKSFCLPRKMYKNYLWHAFSFQKTDSTMGEDAAAELEKGLEGECFLLLNDFQLLFLIPDGRVINSENAGAFDNLIVFTRDFKKTYVNTGKEEFGPYFKYADSEDEPVFVFEEENEEESADI